MKLYTITSIFIIHLLLSSQSSSAQTIVLDAGHGGHSPGAVYGKIYEKTINLNIALRTEVILKRMMPTINIIQTRRTDKEVTLAGRTEIANKSAADIFISIHANSNKNRSAKGIETYVMGENKSKDNLAVAMRENEVITLEENYQQSYNGYDPKSTESFIIFSLMQYAHQEQSLNLASMIQGEYNKSVSLNSRGVKQDGFLVLWRTSMPAVLTEVGFMSNDTDRKYITSRKGVNEISESLANAIVNYLKENKKNSVAAIIKPRNIIKPNNVTTPTTINKDELIATTNSVRMTRTKTIATTIIDTATHNIPDIKQLAKTTVAHHQINDTAANNTSPSAKTNTSPLVTNDTILPISPSIVPSIVPAQILTLANPATKVLKQRYSQSPSKKIPTFISPQINNQVYYTIQILASKKERNLNATEFIKWGNTIQIRADKNLYKYSVGKYQSYNDAYGLQKQLRKDFPGCFIIALEGTTQITINEAKKILNQ